MGRTPQREPQVTLDLWRRAQPTAEPSAAEATGEYIVSLLRVLARKEPGEPWLEAEREACRNALRAVKRNW